MLQRSFIRTQSYVLQMKIVTHCTYFIKCITDNCFSVAIGYDATGLDLVTIGSFPIASGLSSCNWCSRAIAIAGSMHLLYGIHIVAF
jgi:hypothetical protein